MTATVSQDPDRAEHYPRILTELAEAITGAIMRKGIAPEMARSLAEEAVEEIRTTFGGEIVYIPQAYHHRLQRRNREIRRLLAAGEPRDAVCRKHGLSDAQLRRIQNGGDSITSIKGA